VQRSQITIDLGALRRNVARLREAAGSAELWAVVKADAYGHGAVAVAAALANEGADKFAVACIEEGIELRRAAIAGEIAILGKQPAHHRPDRLVGRDTEALLDRRWTLQLEHVRVFPLLATSKERIDG